MSWETSKGHIKQYFQSVGSNKTKNPHSNILNCNALCKYMELCLEFLKERGKWPGRAYRKTQHISNVPFTQTA